MTPFQTNLVRWSWKLLFAFLITLLVTLTIFRLTIASLPLIQQRLMLVLSERMQTDLQIEQLEARWQRGIPSLSLRGLTLKGQGADQAGFRINQFDMELNLRSSLLQFTPIFNSLEIKDVQVNLVQGEGARWHLKGIGAIAGSSTGVDLDLRGRFLEWLSLQNYVDISNIELDVTSKEGVVRRLSGREISVFNENGLKHLRGRLEAGKGFAELTAVGQGRNRWSASWVGAIKAESFDLEQLCVLWSGCYDDLKAVELELDAAWGVRNSHWQVQGNLGASRIVYRDANGVDRQMSAKSNLFVQWQRDKQWQVWLNEFQLLNNIDDQALQSWQGNWFLSGEMKNDYQITLASESLDLDSLKRWLLAASLLPEKASNLVRTLNPVGKLEKLALRFNPEKKPFDVDLSVELNDVSVDAWKGAPSSSNINGRVRMSLLKGYLDLDTRDLSLGLTKVFRDVWYYDTAKARLYWDIIDDIYILKSDNIALKAPEGDLRGKLRLDIPLNGDKGRTLDMALTVGMSNGDARYTPKYLPARVPGTSPAMVEWLDNAIRGARVNEGGFYFNGAISGGELPQDARWGLYFDIEDAELEYSPDWPVVTDIAGKVFVNDDRVEVRVENGETGGAGIQQAIAMVTLDDDPVVSIQGDVSADGVSVKRFLTETPVNKLMNGEAEQWQLAGTAKTRLDLQIPIERISEADVDIAANLSDFTFSTNQNTIEVVHIMGDLAFSTQNGLNAKSLSGTFLGEQADFSINTEITSEKPMTTHIVWNSQMTVMGLQQWLQQDWISLLEGKTGYRGRLVITPDGESTELFIESDLQGIEIELPAPLEKEVNSRVPFKLSLSSKPENNDLLIQLGDMGRAHLSMGPDFSLESASVALGKDDEIPDLKSGDVRITGQLSEFDIAPWKDRFEGQPARADELSLAGRLVVENLAVGKLKYADNSWSDMLVSFRSEEDALRLTLSGKPLDGSLWIPLNPDKPYRLELEKLHFPKESKADKESKPRDLLADIDPSILPDFDVNIKSIQEGDQDQGSVSFTLRHAENGVTIDNLKSQLEGMRLTGFVDWVRVNGEHRTWFQGKLSGKDIDRVQAAAGIPVFVEAKNTEVDSKLNWKGSPLGVDFKMMSGTVDLDISKGKIRNADGNAEALKIFGILNTESLKRRLQLDFSDLFSSGISFDNLEGQLRFHQGVVTFDSPIVIEGPSSNFKLDGIVDGNNQNMNLNMVVTLPVTSNLPIMSLLLGTAPQVAGIIFIADKLVGKQVEQLASIRYLIQGTFDDPQMTLDQLFSNKTKKAERPKVTENPDKP